MVKVITYGTFDLLHHGHIRLLERAKALGDYLIVGVTADDFDKARGKINCVQTSMERIEALEKLGIADEIIIEEYEGQKIDDIKKHNISIFTVGSDWEGTFDYLKEYCDVVYLPRTEGISSSELRAEDSFKMGVVGESVVVQKVCEESKYVNGIELEGICTTDSKYENNELNINTNDYDELIEKVDVLYIVSHPSKHYDQIKKALNKGIHVMCESPITETREQTLELIELSKEKNCVLMEAIKTAYSTAYSRLLLLIKTGKIGDVLSVDSTCTSLKMIKVNDKDYINNQWNSICSWGPTAMLPIFQILGVNYSEKKITTTFADDEKTFDLFTKINFDYEKATASIKVGKGIKSEGELIISGTKGYAYVPAPWWKTDYFELRFEDSNDNRRYYYQLEGEGIRYEIMSFVNEIKNGYNSNEISKDITSEISSVIEDFNDKRNLREIIIRREQ